MSSFTLVPGMLLFRGGEIAPHLATTSLDVALECMNHPRQRLVRRAPDGEHVRRHIHLDAHADLIPIAFAVTTAVGVGVGVGVGGELLGDRHGFSERICVHVCVFEQRCDDGTHSWQ